MKKTRLVTGLGKHRSACACSCSHAARYFLRLGIARSVWLNICRGFRPRLGLFGRYFFGRRFFPRFLPGRFFACRRFRRALRFSCRAGRSGLVRLGLAVVRVCCLRRLYLRTLGQPVLMPLILPYCGTINPAPPKHTQSLTNRHKVIRVSRGTDQLFVLGHTGMRSAPKVTVTHTWGREWQSRHVLCLNHRTEKAIFDHAEAGNEEVT